MGAHASSSELLCLRRDHSDKRVKDALTGGLTRILIYVYELQEEEEAAVGGPLPLVPEADASEPAVVVVKVR